MAAPSVIDILREQDYITEEDAVRARERETEHSGGGVELLMQEGTINESTLGNALAEYAGTTFTDLAGRTSSVESMHRIPEEVARKYRVVYVDRRGDTLRIASDKVEPEMQIPALAASFPDAKIQITYAFPDAIDAALAGYRKELNTRFAEIVKHDRRVAPELFEEIVKDALSYHASDIHFEPRGENTEIRFRIDGMLQLAGTISRLHYDSVLNRIKIQANARIDEHYAPQDGAIRFTGTAEPVDLRVSIVPTIEGEKTVIRVLVEYVQGLGFESLGFSEKQRSLLASASRKPFGMILVSGPTGSGKTTTLYSLIKEVHTPETNITTIEDPVEYRMTGTNQIQVNAKNGLTFAKGLRAVVRQDPNIILVGEIRDQETAETAVNAALTGHLLLSTFHANDAASTIPRLLDMGVEPFLLASTLELIIAQRLARRICEVCRYSYEVPVAQLPKSYGIKKGTTTVTLYKGKGCSACNNTGYRGRLTVSEMISVSTTLKELIGTRPSALQIATLAKEQGAETMFDDGMQKALAGRTTLEEVLRVAAVQ